jgi:hypothetical protein
MMFIIAILSLVSFVSFVTGVITIIYIGPSFNRTDPIDPQNWKRHWILFFAWFRLVVYGLMIMGTSGSVLYLPWVNFVIIFSLITAAFGISLFGPTFEDKESIAIGDWRRKWVLFLAWVNVFISGITLSHYGVRIGSNLKNS